MVIRHMLALIRMLFVTYLELLGLESKAMPRDLLYPLGLAGIMVPPASHRSEISCSSLLISSSSRFWKGWIAEGRNYFISGCQLPTSFYHVLTLSWKAGVRLWLCSTFLWSIRLSLITFSWIQKESGSLQFSVFLGGAKHLFPSLILEFYLSRYLFTVFILLLCIYVSINNVLYYLLCI